MRFLDAAGEPLHPSPAGLADRLAAMDASAMMALPPVIAACDVDSPLLGPSGATRVFGPQKGVENWMIPRLETFLERLVRVADGDAEARTPGSGAAGGLGFGLLRFANARLVPGFELLADLTGLEAEIAAADLVVTGEGSLDFQTLAGKGPAGVAALARKHAKPVMAFCGAADTAVRESGLFDSITALADSGRPHEVLMARAAEFLEEAAAGAVQIGSGVNGNQ
jgi:glycerate kinase